jgi:hypothetical protein
MITQRSFWTFVGRPELLLVLAVAALLFQLFPPLLSWLNWLIDVRNWTKAVWLWLHVALLGVLLAVRYGPGIAADWRDRQAKRQTDHENKEKQRKLKEERETHERIKDARRRRIY